MEYIFYISSIIAMITTVCVVICFNPMYAIVNLIISIIAISIIFFSLGAYYASIIEIIIYAGAIMILFVFVMMMLNLGKKTILQESNWFNIKTVIFSLIISIILLYNIITLLYNPYYNIKGVYKLPPKVGSLLFKTPYLLIVELSAILMLIALITASHIAI
ncbi:NADH-quinone oxidoreductase subunit J [Candidatus Johnevansia muelleri]|uniref:NADH-quinone oxidoreductase subunit J n=1 Tax=Candidatus Johnevansia muelleri TaxID=1495769 RepID=A0A078KBL2_9GAMM|nr:NADH-quinone oxidoreductase subunit J [Candidatus Evansia muelleri]